MSDEYYRERAARRARVWWFLGLLILIIACGLFGAYNLFRDACTRSSDRSPQAVIRAYIDNIRQGNIDRARECWERDAYFNLESGCSEICLAHVSGTDFQIKDIHLQEPPVLENGRARLNATVAVACPLGGQEETGQITLDSTSKDYPWRHWHILKSDFGGTVADPWCK